ncbi:MAG TPA: hypothetical protein VIY08_11430, partial [Candidatus Nitrosocosmicus sp.]
MILNTIYYTCTRNRSTSKIIGYRLYLYFLDLSFGTTAKALSFLLLVKVSHLFISNWIQKYKTKKFSHNSEIKEYIIDETAIKTGSELIYLWVIIEPKHREIVACC